LYAAAWPEAAASATLVQESRANIKLPLKSSPLSFRELRIAKRAREFLLAVLVDDD
jgi:hypothetical protein